MRNLQRAGTALTQGDVEPATTMMVRNIPLECTQEELMAVWTNNGTYDFLYLPRNSSGRINLGYAFINFTSAEHAADFKTQWHRTGFPNYPGVRLSVGYAGVQGLLANIQELKSKSAGRIRARQCKPFILLDGHRVDLEELAM